MARSWQRQAETVSGTLSVAEWFQLTMLSWFVWSQQMGLRGSAELLIDLQKKADSSKESSCEVILAAILAAGLLSVDVGITSVVRSSGINDSIARVSSGADGVVSDSGAGSAVAGCSITSSGGVLSCAIAFSTGVAWVLGGSSKSVKFKKRQWAYRRFDFLAIG